MSVTTEDLKVLGLQATAAPAIVTIGPDRPPDTASRRAHGTTCIIGGCGGSLAAMCRYTDRRRALCGKSLCAKHVVVQSRVAMCAQHAIIGGALSPGFSAVQRPDLANTAPAVTSAGARFLDDQISQILAAYCSPGTSERVASTPLHPVRVRNTFRWDWGWRVLEHTGSRLSVRLGSDEIDPRILEVRVNEAVIARTRPPWVDEHAAYVGLRSDDQRVTEYCAAVHNLIDDAVARDCGTEQTFAPLVAQPIAPAPADPDPDPGQIEIAGVASPGHTSPAALAAAARLAQHICGTSLAAILVGDGKGLAIRALSGGDDQMTRRAGEMTCTVLPSRDSEAVACDPAEDERCDGNGLWSIIPGCHFYASVPIRNGRGVVLGVIAVADHATRPLLSLQREALRDLAVQVASGLSPEGHY